MNDACAGRIPMFIFAGRPPLGTRGERPEGRNHPVHFFQDVRDQAGIVRQYCKWEFNLEAPEQAAYAFHRAVRMMQSDPKGPIYFTAAREVLGQPVAEMRSENAGRMARPKLGRLSAEDAQRLAERLARAERPLVITSYLGRQTEAVHGLVGLSEALGLPVIETFPTHLNFPRDHAHHWGFKAAPAVGDADLILLADTDVPWLARYGAPKTDAEIVQLDVDPVKPHITMWDFPVTESHWVDTAQALPLLHECARGSKGAGRKVRLHQDWLETHRPRPQAPARTGRLSAETVSAVIGRLLDPEAVVFEQGVTSDQAILAHTRRTLPGTYFGTPGSSLGWAGGAALGYKLARPEADIAVLIGDGSFIFGAPSSLYMTAQRYRLPFLTVIYNNGGWRAVREATVSVYGDTGAAAKHDAYLHHLGPTARLEQVAGAFGCHTCRAETVEELERAVRESLSQVRQGRPAVVNAILEPV
jgi:acetolactate synthase-1/2/3 large subunit